MEPGILLRLFGLMNSYLVQSIFKGENSTYVTSFFNTDSSILHEIFVLLFLQYILFIIDHIFCAHFFLYQDICSLLHKHYIQIEYHIFSHNPNIQATNNAPKCLHCYSWSSNTGQRVSKNCTHTVYTILKFHDQVSHPKGRFSGYQCMIPNDLNIFYGHTK